MPYALGIDLSTQSCTVLALELDRADIHRCSVQFGSDLPQYNAPNGFIPDMPDGQVHADPRMWLDALELAFQRMGKEIPLSEIVSIGGAAQQHGSVYLNAKWHKQIAELSDNVSLSAQLETTFSRVTAPIWMDSSTSDDCATIAQALNGNDVVSSITGSGMIERFTGPQIHRFARTEPDAYKDTSRIHMISSFISSVLVGTDAQLDYGDASGMNLLNLSDMSWHETLLEATASGLKEKLPQLAPSGNKVGSIAQYFHERFGLNKDAVVGVFTGDNHASHLGLIAGDSTPEQSLVISLGTSDTLFARVASAITDPERQGHLFCHPLGGYFALQCVTNGALARDRIRQELGMDWEQFAQAIQSTAPGSKGNFILPLYGPETSPRVNTSKPFIQGSGEFRNREEPAALVRACVEGQAMNLRKQTAWLNLKPESIKLTGGASQSAAIAQVIADVFNSPVERLDVADSVALGGLKLGLRALKGDEGLNHPALSAFRKKTSVTQPDAQAVQAYEKIYHEFCSFLEGLIN